MKGLPVFFTALAEEDLDQIEDYISSSRPSRGCARQGRHRPAKPSAWKHAGERNGFESATQ